MQSLGSFQVYNQYKWTAPCHETNQEENLKLFNAERSILYVEP